MHIKDKESATIIEFKKPVPDRCSGCNKPFVKRMKSNDPAYCCQRCAAGAKVREEKECPVV